MQEHQWQFSMLPFGAHARFLAISILCTNVGTATQQQQHLHHLSWPFSCCVLTRLICFPICTSSATNFAPLATHCCLKPGSSLSKAAKPPANRPCICKPCCTLLCCLASCKLLPVRPTLAGSLQVLMCRGARSSPRSGTPTQGSAASTPGRRPPACLGRARQPFGRRSQLPLLREFLWDYIATVRGQQLQHYQQCRGHSRSTHRRCCHR